MLSHNIINTQLCDMIGASRVRASVHLWPEDTIDGNDGAQVNEEGDEFLNIVPKCSGEGLVGKKGQGTPE